MQHSTHSGNSGTGHAHFLAIPLTGKITKIALFTMMQLFNCLKTLFLQYKWWQGILFNVGLKFLRPLLHPDHAPPRPIFISSTNKFIEGRDQWQTLVSLTVFMLDLQSAADRLGLSNQQVTGVLASIVNHSGGNLDDVSISTSTSRNSQTTARKEAASYTRKTFSFTCGQVNFDGKLLQEFGVTEKVNRLAVVAVQEEENQLFCVTKTEDSTGKVEADAVNEAINNWGLSEGIIACCFDTTQFIK